MSADRQAKERFVLGPRVTNDEYKIFLDQIGWKQDEQRDWYSVAKYYHGREEYHLSKWDRIAAHILVLGIRLRSPKFDREATGRILAALMSVESAESLLGDLEERYERDLVRMGRFRARADYAVRLLWSFPPLIIQRLLKALRLDALIENFRQS